ncbi:MAG: VacB/RNase II family 3'-5' exoribonuclease [Buchnera aphidicola (Periphyllus acericola)]|uniref:ribonuclease R family protein n=1 Tax=Buchnera aphidicola TaxID=9 RepID=UPI0030D2CB04|nr:VacB/RNase II family 3'-5' exoribonuclease [Buchnera aphidicola (Periphyllus acericola)]
MKFLKNLRNIFFYILRKFFSIEYRIINIKILKKKINLNNSLKYILKKYKISSDWSEEILNSVKLVKSKKYFRSQKNRKDLRNFPFITIDEKDSYDFDDAIYCYKIKKNLKWKLFVAVSDVSFYVKENSLLDKEALNRGTSIYFPCNVIPMLPEELSEDICSLLPNQDRLCIVCEMTLSKNGKLLHYVHYKSIIKSHARLTYSNVIKIWNGDKFLCNKFKKIKKNIIDLFYLNKILVQNKDLKKIILFNSDEPDFIFDSSFKIKCISLKKKNLVHNFIEYCMILANKSSALFIKENNVISLFRNHAYPVNSKIKNFRRILKKFNLKLEGGNFPTFKNYLTLSDKIFNKPYKEIIELALLRSTKKAFYSEKNSGHFGLAEKFYTHFTSPIRRYSDLIVHRTIKFILFKKYHIGNYQKKFLYKRKFLYNFKNMQKIAKQCSISEKRADKAYKFFIDTLKFDFIKNKIGHNFYGYISHITEFGFFVKINNIFLDGLVHVSRLTDDYYFYDKKKIFLKGKRFKKIFSIGDLVHVKIISIKNKNKMIHLSLI